MAAANINLLIGELDNTFFDNITLSLNSFAKGVLNQSDKLAGTSLSRAVPSSVQVCFVKVITDLCVWSYFG